MKSNDPELLVDLQRLSHEVYDRAAYDLEIDYRSHPPLSDQDAQWVDSLLKQHGLRT